MYLMIISKLRKKPGLYFLSKKYNFGKTNPGVKWTPPLSFTRAKKSKEHCSENFFYRKYTAMTLTFFNKFLTESVIPAVSIKINLFSLMSIDC